MNEWMNIYIPHISQTHTHTKRSNVDKYYPIEIDLVGKKCDCWDQLNGLNKNEMKLNRTVREIENEKCFQN